MAHRGAFKTTALSIVAPIWFMFFNPNARILVASATSGNAEKIFQEIKSHYTGDALRDLYLDVYGIEEPRNLEKWRADGISVANRVKKAKEPNLMACGIGTTITGLHFDIIHADDVVTEEDRYSEATRESKKRWLRAAQAIIDPTGRMQYVGTPWHPNDAYTIAPPPKKYPLGHESVKIPGLTPEKIENTRRNMGESLFRAQYYLEHIPEADRLFDKPNFAEPPENTTVTAYLDPAFTVNNKSDSTALTIGTFKDGKWYIMAGYLWQETIDVIYDRVVEMMKLHQCVQITVESNQAQRLIGTELKKRGIHVLEKVNVKNKALRIQDAVKKNWSNICFSSRVSESYLQQVLDYTITPPAQHDDAPDSLAGFIETFKNSFSVGKLSF